MDTIRYYSYKYESHNNEILIWGLDPDMNDVLIRVQDYKYNVVIEVPQQYNKYDYMEMSNYLKDNLLRGLVHHIKGITIFDYEYAGSTKAFRVYLKSPNNVKRIQNKLKYNQRKNKWKCKFKLHEYQYEWPLQLVTEYNLSYSNWHYINNYSIPENKISKCNNEFIVSGQNITSITKICDSNCDSNICECNISKINIVPSVISYDIECYSNKFTFPSPTNLKDEIFIITSTYKNINGTNNVAFILKHYTGPDIPNTTIVECNNEEELLLKFQEYIIDRNPEILIGYNTDSFDNPYITQRLYNYGLDWSNISKLRDYNITTERPNKIAYDSGKSNKRNQNKFNNRNKRDSVKEYLLIPGILHIDMFVHISANKKLRSYSLNSVSNIYLKESKHDVKPHDMFRAYHDYQNNVELYNDTVAYGIQDSILPLKLFDKLLVFLSLSKLSHVMSTNIDDFYMQGSSHKVKNMLFREFRKNKSLFRNTEYSPGDENGYQGAIVVDPITGIHYFVLTLDLDSLYPNIIRSYNICFTTLIRTHHQLQNIPAHTLELTDNGNEYCYKFRKDIEGVIPKLLTKLIAERTEVRRRKSDNPIINMINNELQNAIKIAANSVYGILGLSSSNVSFMEGARSVTAMGRHIISVIKNYIETNYGYKVLYGDTDSVMVQIPGVNDNGKVYELADKLKDDLNIWLKKDIGKTLGLKLEKVGTILLFKKKKYVYHYYDINTGNMEVDKYGNNIYHITGAESVRRDKCLYQIALFDKITDMIMSKSNRIQIYNYLYNSGLNFLLRYDMLTNSPLKYEDLLISYTINDNYKSDNYTLAVLMRRLKEEEYNINPGERKDVIIVSGNTERLGERLFTSDEFYEQIEGNNDRDLHPDLQYYLSNRMKNTMDKIYTIAFGSEITETHDDIQTEYMLNILDQYSGNKSLQIIYDKYPNYDDPEIFKKIVSDITTKYIKQVRFKDNYDIKLLAFRLNLLKRKNLDFGIHGPLKQLLLVYQHKKIVMLDLLNNMHNNIPEEPYDYEYYE